MKEILVRLLRNTFPCDFDILNLRVFDLFDVRLILKMVILNFLDHGVLLLIELKLLAE